ncbi:hypothetical protein D9M68_943560 [compost metagenome]
MLRPDATPPDVARGDVLVVSRHGEKPRLGQPPQHLLGLRPAINHVAHREQPIPARIKPHCLQGPPQGAEIPVDVADGEVAAGRIALNAPDQAHATALAFMSASTRARISPLSGV